MFDRRLIPANINTNNRSNAITFAELVSALKATTTVNFNLSRRLLHANSKVRVVPATHP